MIASAPFRSPSHDRRRPASGTPLLWRALLILCVVGMLTNGVAFNVGSNTLTLERALGLALLPLLGYVLLARGASAKSRALVWLWFGWCLVLLLSAVMTGRFSEHFVPWLMAALPVAYLALFVVRRFDGDFFYTVLRRTMWIFGVVGTVAFALARIGGGAKAVSFLIAPFDGRLRLLTFEPNILGSSIAAITLATLPRARFRWPDIVLYAFVLVTFLAAGSKMPFIALTIGAVVYFALKAVARGKGLSGALIVPAWLAVFLMVVLLAVLPGVQDFYNSTLARPDAIMGRAYMNGLALERFREAPVIGRGPGDFGLNDISILKRLGTTSSKNLWIAQMMLSILHDSGVVGMVFYITFLVSLCNRAFNLVRLGSLDHCGYFAAFLSLIISSQATTVHLNAIFGIFAGLLATIPITIWKGYPTRRRRVPQRLLEPAIPAHA